MIRILTTGKNYLTLRRVSMALTIQEAIARVPFLAGTAEQHGNYDGWTPFSLGALAGLALPAPCSGPDRGTSCPCERTEPESTSSCCPDEENCDACDYCARCGTESNDPQGIAPASVESVRIRLAPVVAAPAIASVGGCTNTN